MTVVIKLKNTSWKESYDKPRQCCKKQRHYFPDNGPCCQSYGFSNSHVHMWMCVCVCESCSAVSNSLWPHGLYSPWNSKGQNTGVGSLSLLQGIFPTRDWTQVFCIAGGFFTSWATREAHRCESRTIKKAKCQRIDAFELWCWRRLLRVPWSAGRSNQSILKKINTKYSLAGLLLKLQYFGHLMWRVNSLEKILALGKTEGKRRRGWQRMRWLDSITDSMDMNLSKLGDSGRQGRLAGYSQWSHTRTQLDLT